MDLLYFPNFRALSDLNFQGVFTTGNAGIFPGSNFRRITEVTVREMEITSIAD